MKISQGAEAIIEKNGDSITKKRIQKGYRIKELDEEIRKHRTRAEAKNLAKISTIVNVPKIIRVDEDEAIIEMEFIDGQRLSECLEKLKKEELKKIASLLGKDIAKLHDHNIIHGDLTTSNFILNNQNQIVFIDLGLSFHSTKIEDKAVDLHVLREALESKHYTIWEEFFEHVKKSYFDYEWSAKDNGKEILKRLKDVELRGRNKKKGS